MTEMTRGESEAKVPSGTVIRADDSEKQLPMGSVVHAEDLDAQVRELLQMAKAEGQAIRRATQAETRKVYRIVPRPDIDELLVDDLKRALEDEIVPAIPVRGGSERIQPWDLDREVMKKALVGLKAPSLRQLARDVRVPTTGRAEIVATRIAQHYRWRGEEIARAILEVEGRLEPTGRAHHDRLVPLEEPPNLSYLRDRLQFVINRYIRIGIARWFVFDDVQGDDDHLQLSGTVETYRAYVDDSGEEPRVGAAASERRVDLRFEAGKDLARVRRAASIDARAAMQALEVATQLKVAGYVPLRSTNGLESWAVTFDRFTLFMLDLLNSRFRRNGLHEFDMKAARFRMSPASGDEPDAAPSLEAVRFEGRHILDSTEACRLIATEGRALMSFNVNVRSPARLDGESGRFPISVAMDDWSVVVTTGLGVVQPELSVAVHHAVLEAVEAEIREGVVDVLALNDLAERIADRATSPGSPDRADLLADPAVDA